MGVLASTQVESQTCASVILKDLDEKGIDLSIGKEGRVGLKKLLSSKLIRWCTWEDWREIDEREKKRGEGLGKPREKFTNFNTFINK